MSPLGAASERVTSPAPLARQSGAAKRRSPKHRKSRPVTPGNRTLVGLTAALAAAGAITVTPGAASGSDRRSIALSNDQAATISTARVDRSRLASRDAPRVGLAELDARRKQIAAAEQALARARALASQQARIRSHAAALASARAAARAKAAARMQAASAANDARLMISGYRITATFGQGGSRWSRTHTGTDFAAPIGTRIGAVMAGRVVSVEFAGAYGRRVIVRHGNGTETWYCHMSEFTVSVGDTVSAGGRVGSVGITGNTTGPHLHFEVHPGGGAAIDPLPWLRDHGLEP